MEKRTALRRRVAPGNNDVIYREEHDFFIYATIIGSAGTSPTLVLLIERI